MMPIDEASCGLEVSSYLCKDLCSHHYAEGFMTSVFQGYTSLDILFAVTKGIQLLLICSMELFRTPQIAGWCEGGVLVSQRQDPKAAVSA